MRIGIFGGSFNPPHKMHKHIALDLIEKAYVDKVIYVPTGNLYQKKELISDYHRYQMLLSFTKNNPKLEVSDYELKQELTYTYQTLEYFKKMYPTDQIYFICGEDNLNDLPNWKNYKTILENYYLLVISRRNISNTRPEILLQYLDHIIFTDVEMGNISSTEIRNALKNNLSLKEDVLDSDVITYIKNNHLYGL